MSNHRDGVRAAAAASRRSRSALLRAFGVLLVGAVLLASPLATVAQSDAAPSTADLPAPPDLADKADQRAEAEPAVPAPSEEPPPAAASDRSDPESGDGPARPRARPAPAAPQPAAPEEPTPEPRRDRPAKQSPPSPTPAAGDAKRRHANDDATRVWPLRPGSFTFTQAFGCVPQIGGFYNADPGCPPSRPVVHTGIDLAAPAGTRIYAAAAGTVTEAGLDRETGLANSRIVIQHEGRNGDYATEYLHWERSYVRAGDHVRAGEPIAEVGSVGWSTGPHLHFGVTDFRTGERVDPLRWLPKDRASGGYLGVEPGARTFRVPTRSAPLPDYADPNPAPVPERHHVPKQHKDRTAGEGKSKHGRHHAKPGDRGDQTTSKERRRKHHDTRNDGTSASNDVNQAAAPTGETGGTGGRDGAKRDRKDGGLGAGDRAAKRDTGNAKGDRSRSRDGGQDQGKTPESAGKEKSGKTRDASTAGEESAPPEPSPSPGIALPPPVPGVPAVPPPVAPAAGGTASAAAPPPAETTTKKDSKAKDRTGGAKDRTGKENKRERS